jgi:aryl-alcohol dehydrogenase-like predicted oxidoreductase
MQYRKLGPTDIDVSVICLGSMTWGEQNTLEEAFRQLDYAVDQGVNFIDTAEVYPSPMRAGTQGTTEQHIGRWLQQRTDRDRLVIATKMAPAASYIGYLRDGKNRLDKKNMRQAVDASLRRLQTDYIDLYQVHWPERDTNFFGRQDYYHAPEKDGTPIEETLGALDEQVRAGKIRYAGVSNETPWGLGEYLRLARAADLPRIVSIQNPYSLLNRSFEIGLAEFAHRERVGLLAYSPLGFGVLSGKYLNGNRPPGARLTLFGAKYKRYNSKIAEKCTRQYVAVARDCGIEPAQLALAFVNRQPFLTSSIIGATTMEQLAANIASADLKLDRNVLKRIEEIHRSQPNPCP